MPLLPAAVGKWPKGFAHSWGVYKPMLSLHYGIIRSAELNLSVRAFNVAAPELHVL